MKAIPTELAPWVQRQQALGAILGLNPSTCNTCWYQHDGRCPEGAFAYQKTVGFIYTDASYTFCPFWEPDDHTPDRICSPRTL